MPVRECLTERMLMVWRRCRSSSKEWSKLGWGKAEENAPDFSLVPFSLPWYMAAETGSIIKWYFVDKTFLSLGIYYKAPISILRGARTVQVRSRADLGRREGASGRFEVDKGPVRTVAWVLCSAVEFVLNAIEDKQITLRSRGFMGAEGKGDIFIR